MPPSESATCRSGKRSGHAGPQPFAGGEEGVHGEHGGQQFERWIRRGEGRPRGCAGVEAHDGRGLLAGGEEGIPSAAEDGGQLQLGGELREADRFEAAGRVGPDLGRGELHVGQPGELQGDDAVRVRSRPHLEVPIVEGPHAGEPEILVRRPRVDRTAEARDQRRKAQRGPDAGAVHVQNAGVDVEAAGPHFVEAGRLHAPLRPRSTDDCVEPDVGIQLPLEDPALGPVFLLHDAGRPRGEGGRQPVLEEVRGFDQVVVDRDHGHPDRPGLRVGEQGGPARCGPCVDGSHGKVTLSSANVVRPGGAHDHIRR